VADICPKKQPHRQEGNSHNNRYNDVLLPDVFVLIEISTIGFSVMQHEMPRVQ